ncbi:phosphatidylinositide phosphatase SAC1 [Planoprotostelium fungivorum]|uniref:Phosphatidylinositide phosphatase SAC1 n=1 Tax=Planoprotostelium fungivorum TaxID=1890364 RepID=A0A2P6NTY7_9EUKA|nr:phosphatidylinositide phosphatase SAC1 [Planoprotostelium fungivorum]
MSYDRIRLESANDSFILDPVVQSGQKEVLFIPRNGAAGAPISFNTRVVDAATNTAQGGEEIFGLLGIIHLLRGPYLVVITGRTAVARIKERTIWMMTKHKLIPFSTSLRLTPVEQQDEERYISMLNTLLGHGRFYFAHGMDITRKLQYAFEENSNNFSHTKVDERFFWNRFLAEPLIHSNEKLDRWILPVMMGFIQSESATISNKRFDFILISRRNWKRAGTRYNVRGIDNQGNVANNVETEQIVVYEGTHVSYVILRGSIPVFWSQKANLKYKPKPVLTRSEQESLAACRKHFDELFSNYGSQTVVNLIDHKGGELLLGYSFENQMRECDTSKIKYVAFDFHKEVHGMKYERLSVLLDQIREEVNQQQFFVSNKEGQINSKQRGTCRVNCIDNLDRTNVVQSLISRYVLNRQLIQLGIIQPTDDFKRYDGFEKTFKNIWANNGDAMSVQYTGTGALKADYTRTGKRSFRGNIDDGINSLKRYYLNNFSDGFQQDSFDLLLGNYKVDRDSGSPFKALERETQIFFAVIVALLLFVALALFTPTEADFSYTVKFLFFAFWVGLGYLGGKTLLSYGSHIVNSPKLVLEH